MNEAISFILGGISVWLLLNRDRGRDPKIERIHQIVYDNNQKLTKIMATLAELNEKIDELEATVNAEQEQIAAAILGLQTTIDELRAQLEDQDPAAIQAAIDRLDAIKADLESTVADEEEPEEPTDPEEPTV